MTGLIEKELILKINHFLSAKGVDCSSSTLSASINALLKSAKESGEKNADNDIKTLITKSLDQVERLAKEGRFEEIGRLSDNVQHTLKNGVD